MKFFYFLLFNGIFLLAFSLKFKSPGYDNFPDLVRFKDTKKGTSNNNNMNVLAALNAQAKGLIKSKNKPTLLPQRTMSPLSLSDQARRLIDKKKEIKTNYYRFKEDKKNENVFVLIILKDKTDVDSKIENKDMTNTKISEETENKETTQTPQEQKFEKLNLDSITTNTTQAVSIKLDGIYLGNKRIQLDDDASLEIQGSEYKVSDIKSLFDFNKKLIAKCGDNLDQCLFTNQKQEKKEVVAAPAPAPIPESNPEIKSNNFLEMKSETKKTEQKPQEAEKKDVEENALEEQVSDLLET